MGFFFFFIRIAFSIFSYTLAPSREMSPFVFFWVDSDKHRQNCSASTGPFVVHT